MEENINIMDYLLILLRKKKFIAKATLVSALFAVALSLVLPNKYTAETRIRNSQGGAASITSQLMSQVSGMMGMSLGGSESGGEMIASMLTSRTVLDNIIDRFGLVKEYEVEFKEDARNILTKNIMKIKVDKKTEIVTLQITTKNPETSAVLANAIVDELNSMNQSLNITEASQKKQFFEEQIKNTKQALTKAEEEVKAFQENTGALSIDDQTKAVIASLADIKANIASREVQLSVMKTYATSQNPDVQRLESEIKGLKNELGKLERKGKAGHNPLMSTGTMPEVGTEYIRKLRELKYNETLYELLVKQFELNRMEEAKTISSIQIIDRAVPPEKKSKPKRALIVIFLTFTGFFISVFISFFMQYYEKIENEPESNNKLIAFREHIPQKLKTLVKDNRIIIWFFK